jgi:hypothetical protein
MAASAPPRAAFGLPQEAKNRKPCVSSAFHGYLPYFLLPRLFSDTAEFTQDFHVAIPGALSIIRPTAFLELFF